MKKMLFTVGSAFAITLVQYSVALAGPLLRPSPVPEPATLTLMAIGLGGVAAASRLRKRNKK